MWQLYSEPFALQDYDFKIYSELCDSIFEIKFKRSVVYIEIKIVFEPQYWHDKFSVVKLSLNQILRFYAKKTRAISAS